MGFVYSDGPSTNWSETDYVLVSNAFLIKIQRIFIIWHVILFCRCFWKSSLTLVWFEPILDRRNAGWATRELKQRGRERERYKTADLVTEYNRLTWECNHLATFTPSSSRPMQTDAILLANNTQHFWAQLCCDLLRLFAWNHNIVGT